MLFLNNQKYTPSNSKNAYTIRTFSAKLDFNSLFVRKKLKSYG